MSWHTEGIRFSSVEALKVLFLTHSFPRYKGDAPGSFLLRLAVALGEQDVSVSVVAPAAPGYPDRDVIEGIGIERFRYAPRRFETLAYTGNMAQDVSKSWSARAALAGYMGAGIRRALSARRLTGSDLIHAHWWFPSGITGRIASKISRKPLVTTLHGTDVRMAKAIRSSRPFFRGVMNSSARVTTVSSWLAAQVEELQPAMYPDVAPMPAATDRFRPGRTREAARFLFAGRLNRQKGLDHLLKALATMSRPAMLDVVGDGADAKSLRLMASQLGVSDRIVWHGQLDQDGLLRMYQSATAVIVPSTDEGLGLVAAEALLCEAPVIAFRSGGLTDIINEGKTGFLVTPGDTAELARALDAVLEAPEHAGNLARAGRMFALSAFSPETAALRYAEIYRVALSRGAT